MAARATQDSLDLGWSDEPLDDASPSPDPSLAPLDNSDDDEPTRVATAAAFAIAPTRPDEPRVDDAPAIDAPAIDAPTIDAPAIEAAAPPDPSADTEPSLQPPVATEASSAGDELQAPPAVHQPPVLEAPPPAHAPPVLEAVAPSTDTRAERSPRSVPPITNPAPAELARPPLAVVPATAPTPSSPPASTPPQSSPPASNAAPPGLIAPPPSEPRSTAAPAAFIVPPPLAPASIAPPPLAPALFAPASLAPTATDWNELGSPSFIETMKRTRPTSAWTGVALFLAAATFVGGLGIGHGISSPSLPPVPVPAAPPANLAAAAPATPSRPSTPPAAVASPADTLGNPSASVPAAPVKQLPPFDAKAARAALDAAAAKAKTCRAAKDPKGAMLTTVTFAPSGRVSGVAINTARYAGTKTGSCVTERLTEAQTPEFSGFPEAIKKTIAVR